LFQKKKAEKYKTGDTAASPIDTVLSNEKEPMKYNKQRGNSWKAGKKSQTNTHAKVTALVQRGGRPKGLAIEHRNLLVSKTRPKRRDIR